MPNCPIYPQNRLTKGHRRIRQNLEHLFQLCRSAVQYVSPFRGIEQVQPHEVKRKRHSKDRRDLQQELSFWVRVHLERAQEPVAGLPTQVQRPRRTISFMIGMEDLAKHTFIKRIQSSSNTSWA